MPLPTSAVAAASMSPKGSLGGSPSINGSGTTCRRASTFEEGLATFDDGHVCELLQLAAPAGACEPDWHRSAGRSCNKRFRHAALPAAQTVAPSSTRLRPSQTLAPLLQHDRNTGGEYCTANLQQLQCGIEVCSAQWIRLPLEFARHDQRMVRHDIELVEQTHVRV